MFGKMFPDPVLHLLSGFLIIFLFPNAYPHLNDGEIGAS
jgi:hypothetical protein